MGNNQVKQSMKCFYCNEVSFISIVNDSENLNNNKTFNISLIMKCPNEKCLKETKLTIKEYFNHRHSFRSERVPCKTCTKHENEMFLCHKCQEISNDKNPIIFCPKCKDNHQLENPEHLTLSMNYLNSKCYIHRKDFVAYDENLKRNICQECIDDENNKIDKEKIIYLDKIKYSEYEIEDLLENVKLQMAKINTIKMMNLTTSESEMKKFKEYLQNKMYFIELEWLIIGEIVGTPNNYQTIQNIKSLMENKYNTLKNNEIFNDEDPIGISIKNIVDKKNAERKVKFIPVQP